MEPQFKNPSTLGYYARHLNQWHDGGWLFIRADSKVAFDTPCYLQAWDDKDLSPEEQEEFDRRIPELGYRLFLEWGQLSEIADNLEDQKPDFNDSDLEKAILFYWRRDAFIDLTAGY